MELLQLTYFCDAAETENFSLTAKKYGVPASNISQCIKRLESEVDTPLFDRRANRITLNEQGRVFYRHVRAALTSIQEAKAALVDVQTELAGEIRLNICTNRRVVTEAIEVFRRQHPSVTFAISHNALAEEPFDLIISDEHLRLSGMERTLLIRESLLLAANKDSQIAKKKTVRLQDLKQERFITMPKGSSMHRLTVDICQKAGFVPNIAIRTDDPFYIRKYVAMGLGIALVPSVSWQGQFEETVVCKEIGSFTRNTYVFRDGSRYMTRAVREFLDLLQSICRQMQ